MMALVGILIIANGLMLLAAGMRCVWEGVHNDREFAACLILTAGACACLAMGANILIAGSQ